jgi:hypothetical protein
MLMSETKTSQILALAYDRIDLKQDYFVCLALTKAAEGFSSNTAWQKAYQLKTRIAQALGGEGKTVEDWLLEQRHAKGRQMTIANMRNYRLAWIKELIQEYQSKGD